MQLPAAPLEDWLRDYYFDAETDISGSGVASYSLADVRRLTGIGAELDELVFDDGYSVGARPVRELLAARWGDGDPDKVLTSNGSSEAITLVLAALIRPGDEVVVVRPGYHSLTEYAVWLGATARTWHIDVEKDWRPSLDELAGLVTERTKAIIVNFPQNPTGVSITEPELRELVEIARGVGAYLLWDAAFWHLVYDVPPLPELCGLYERAVSFHTFSKAFGLPGLRFGWCVAPPEVVEGCVRVKDYTTLHVAPLLEILARGVLENADAFLEPRLKLARRNRELVEDWARSQAERISLVTPTGGVAAFPRLLGVADTGDFCEHLYRRYGTLVVPGSCFGAPEHLRLGFGCETDVLARGLERLDSALADWTGRR